MSEHDHARAVAMFGECPTCVVRSGTERDDGRTAAAARSTDPSTSHVAARSLDVVQLRESQRAVLDLFVDRPEMTLEELVDAAHAVDVSFSDSRIRTAAAELVSMALLVDTGRLRTTRAGRPARILASPL